jgi:hypothetical protein
MNIESKWLDDLGMVRERLHGRADALNGLANAFSRTGNDEVAKELVLAVKVLNECAESVSNVSGVVTTMLLHQAQENSANMLKAALAGVVLAERNKDRCPTCNSPRPTSHPAMAEGGEVQPCKDPWHASTEEGRRTLETIPKQLMEKT